jgi:hypothetical protein
MCPHPYRMRYKSPPPIEKAWQDWQAKESPGRIDIITSFQPSRLIRRYTCTSTPLAEVAPSESAAVGRRCLRDAALGLLQQNCSSTVKQVEHMACKPQIEAGIPYRSLRRLFAQSYVASAPCSTGPAVHHRAERIRTIFSLSPPLPPSLSLTHTHTVSPPRYLKSPSKLEKPASLKTG